MKTIHSMSPFALGLPVLIELLLYYADDCLLGRSHLWYSGL